MLFSTISKVLAAWLSTNATPGDETVRVHTTSINRYNMSTTSFHNCIFEHIDINGPNSMVDSENLLVPLLHSPSKFWCAIMWQEVAGVDSGLWDYDYSVGIACFDYSLSIIGEEARSGDVLRMLFSDGCWKTKLFRLDLNKWRTG